MNEPQSARTSSATLRPSACPGLLRIVPALDGGICRIKLAGGVISSVQAMAVAEAAQTYAQGVIEATNRANLQIRGIGADHDGLIKALMAAGLGPANPASDDVRNLMLSPTAGLDSRMLFDARPLAAQVLDALENHPRFHELSPKFALSLDAGEALVMLEHAHDVWLSALNLDGEVLLAFGLAGCPANDRPLAAVPLAAGEKLVVGLLELFLDLARPEHTRMRHLLAEVSTDDVLRELSTRLDCALRVDQAVTGWQRPAIQGNRHIGIYPQAEPARVAVGAVVPLGRLDAATLAIVAQLAEEQGDGTLRLTPWQSLLLPNVPVERAATVMTALQAAGLIGSAEQPLAQMVACTGSAGCAKGLADTKADALQLATGLVASQAVHLSGCTRSCAAAHVAPVTLLAVSPGRYDLYFRDAAHAGFGVLRARDLTIEAVGAQLNADSRSNIA
ncbi:Cobalamin biosynthesis protein CobG [Pseudomonas savastanoi]|uniref:Cobalamin biosynthesis protein CobG n=1 Tax=Pseudomonas savastanoi TaxID=29438 RepID=A0A3M5KAL7_PSESS|nr:precorrin-3B synthase [Pseudomonas savastanoi]RMS21281.1 Cobalamin biosynthesis protein CobG [Pseudomonas savastanoi]RMT32628.1 Cobalamin biosynthesis protein CobG [Pseudomonas savastanoi]